ncbi:MAG: zf-HC2 domain-containing protein [Vicinamibacterales bacterium]
MTCQDLPLVDLVDGELDPASEPDVARHLASCEACRALLDDLRTVRAAAFTVERRQPPPALWPRIQAAVDEERAHGPDPSAGVLGGRWVWLAAAASLVLATAVALVALVGRPATPPQTAASTEVPLVDSVEADLRAAEAHYDKAIQGLEQIARNDTGELEPQVAAVLQKNLLVVDQAIDESRAALRSEPGSATAQDGLFEAMRAKVALLQQTVELINEMRKGNQAEAGRLMQDISR